MFALFINLRLSHYCMAKGKNDLILRDRLQFTLDASGNLPIVYGRVDLSDYVSVVNNQGLSIKEMRVQVRNPNNTLNTGVFNQNLIGNNVVPGNVAFSTMKIIGTTTAYENGQDTGIGSPNLFFNAEITTFAGTPTGMDTPSSITVEYVEYGTPDLHPEGYVVISDLLVGISASQALSYAEDTLELDVMLIAEPVKVTKDELKEMLAQATDL